MLNEIQIKEITAADSFELDKVRLLFLELYSFLHKHGLNMPLIKDGDQIWLDSVMSTLTHTGKLFVATEEDKVIGFAQGVLRVTPEYIGSLLVGSLMHIYVLPEYRKKRVGKLLFAEFEKWCKERKVHSLELQVTSSNLSGQTFWKKMGFKEELIQFRK